jgi:hypothetical protein
MKITLLLFVLACFCSAAFAQKEPGIHLASIRNSSFKPATPQGRGGDSAFLEYVIREVLESPEDIRFVSNRELLTPLCVQYCSEDILVLDDSTKGDKVKFILKTRPYRPEGKSLTFRVASSDSLISGINGKPAYGAVTQLPEKEIDTLILRINGKPLKVPREAYSDLFNPNMCEFDLFQQGIEGYYSLEGSFLYLYIYGGEGQNLYVAKLIFDRQQYLKKVVVEYPELLRYRVMRETFIGY